MATLNKRKADVENMLRTKALKILEDREVFKLLYFTFDACLKKCAF